MTGIGSRARRVEDARLIRGEGRYVSDLPLDALHVGFVRSPHAHARIVAVKTEAAASLPGVVAAYAAGDLPELHKRLESPDAPGARGFFPLARDTVRYVGEPVAVVVASDAAAAADAVEAVEAEYEPLEPVTDPEIAMQGEPLVWEDKPRNIVWETTLGFGDVAGAFENAEVVVESTFTFARAAAAAMEPRAVAAAPGEGEIRVRLWDSTQAPHGVRGSLAQYFDLPEEAIRVTAPDVGGGFGPKGRTYPEEVVLAALAMRLGRPVRWVASRTEDLMTTGQGRGQTHHARMAARRDGTILGIEDSIIHDFGAYTPSGLGVLFNTVRHLIGPYRLPALSVHLTGVFTNKTITSALRGGGRPEGIFMVERMLDRLAEQLNLDRAEIRGRNFIPPEAFPHDTGFQMQGRPVVYDSGDFPRYLGALLEAIDYHSFHQRQKEARERGEYLGLGLAVFIESTGVGTEGARARLDADGKLHLATGSPSTGQGHATSFAQIAAERLGIPIEDVIFSSGDTSLDPSGTGTFASRMTYDGGNAVAMAAGELKRKVLQQAANLLEAAVDDLEIRDGRVSVRGYAERGVSLAEVVRRSDEELVAEAEFSPEHGSVWAGGANAAIVRVDIETGHVEIERYVVVHDSGVLINPALVEGQIEGGVAHGIGNVLYEACTYSADGQFLSSTFADYALPQFDNVPPLEIRHTESASPFSPLGAKGTGESGTIGALPTVVSAIEDALSPWNIHFNRMPITPEMIAMEIEAVQEKNAS